MRPLRAAPVLLLLAVALALSVTVTNGPAGAAPGRTGLAGPCPTDDGVTVIVDYQHLGGGAVTRCAPGPQGNGFDALRNAGFVVDQPTRTPGFACRIDGQPTASTESCVDTPPHDAYWAYWRAKRGGSWVYSDVGAGAPGTAKPGSVQGWSFSDGSNPPPAVSPPAPPMPVTAPPATTPPATTPPAGAPATTSPPAAGGSMVPTTRSTRSGSPTTAPPPTGGAPTSTTVAPAADASVLGASETVPPDDASSTTAPVSTTTTADPDVIELASSNVAPDGGAGSPLPTILGVMLVLVLAGGAYEVRRRRT